MSYNVDEENAIEIDTWHHYRVKEKEKGSHLINFVLGPSSYKTFYGCNLRIFIISQSVSLASLSRLV